MTASWETAGGRHEIDGGGHWHEPNYPSCVVCRMRELELETDELRRKVAAAQEDAMATEAARRLIQRRKDLFHGGPWLAESPPRFNESPICIGCGAEGTVGEQFLFFEHAPDCAAFDLASALFPEQTYED